MKNYTSVDEFMRQQTLWSEELKRLRGILNSTELEETLKWGAPCYTLDGKNVVGMLGFKHYFGLWFHQGALLSDKDKHLINAQEGVTRALRQWRMTSAKDIKVRTIKAYVKEAIEIQRSGKEIKPVQKKALVLPLLLSQALKKNKQAQDAFQAMTKGRQREYADYISEAKREPTKVKRIEKILPMIVSGVGLNDKYRR